MSDNPTAEPTPAPSEPAPEPVVIVETPVAVVETVAEPTPTQEQAPEPVADLPKEPLSLLEAAGKTEEKPKVEEKPAETAEKPPEQPEKPKYEPFKLPDGVTADEKRLDSFRDIASRHGLDQNSAQELLDMHLNAIQAYAAQAEQAAVQAKTDRIRGWRQNSLGDEQIGGSGHHTAMMAAARMRDLLVPDARKEAFTAMLEETGIGDHPEFIRIFHNAARLFDEPAAPPIPARPVPDRGGNGKVSRSAVMYDHPTSRKVAGR